ncbi:peptidoglycan hydrolase [Haladaptatus caseinilyticus]|uniref:peptidoglycan hydrolase n=1 Tax=Haladaptatus caseinilyticus TaxID=2993314 RepID=UPI00224A927E|nr:peptidoglycan-binding protein [Haladaptatus caseinilyticus]
MTKKLTRRNLLRTVGASAVSLPVISSTVSAASDFDWPITGYITSPYGARPGHYAVDIGANGNIGEPIYAARGGVVDVRSYESGGCGNYLKLGHENGYQTMYCHLNSFDVVQGESVSRGQKIGGMGNTGNSSGPHLHFTIEQNGSHLSIPGSDGENVTAGTAIPKDYSGIGGGGGGSYSWPIYSRGDQAEAVYSIQYLLEEHGYSLNYHDGIYGSEVESTVESFQSANGLSVDGVVGPNTWEELYVPVVSSSNDPYWATYGAQHHLRYDEGYSISVDGYYGPETESAIESFQSSAGIAVDGIVGHDTWQALVDIGN